MKYRNPLPDVVWLVWETNESQAIIDVYPGSVLNFDVTQSNGPEIQGLCVESEFTENS
jgi:hypothetical protein